MEIPGINLQFLFEVKIPQKPHHIIGDGPHGFRRITTPRPGGTVKGPRVKGTVLEGGGDPFLIRPDGVGEIDARITIQTDDKALIMMTYKGLMVYTPEGREAYARGETVTMNDYYAFVGVVFETSAEKYQWINRIMGIARGYIPYDIQRPGMAYQVYALS